jgi:hypothetical protein
MVPTAANGESNPMLSGDPDYVRKHVGSQRADDESGAQVVHPVVK